MTAESKLEVLRAVEGAGLPVNQVLSQLGISQSTYYRWRQNFRRRGQVGLHNRPPVRSRTWNQILPEERDKILEIALLFPDWSPRQVACYITDTASFAVSESSVYRILKRGGSFTKSNRKPFLLELNTGSRRPGRINNGRPMRRTCWSRIGGGTTSSRFWTISVDVSWPGDCNRQWRPGTSVMGLRMPAKRLDCLPCLKQTGLGWSRIMGLH